MVMITLFPICYLSQLKHLDMNAIVLGKHARLPSFIKLKPSGLWELKNATSYIHYVILTMYICNFRLLFYSSIYSVYSSCFSQINLMKTGIGQCKRGNTNAESWQRQLIAHFLKLPLINVQLNCWKCVFLLKERGKIGGSWARTNNKLNPRVLSMIQSRSTAHLLLFPYWICKNRTPENGSFLTKIRLMTPCEEVCTGWCIVHAK